MARTLRLRDLIGTDAQPIAATLRQVAANPLDEIDLTYSHGPRFTGCGCQSCEAAR